MQITEFQSLCLSKGVPFFCFRLPGEEKGRMGVQISSEISSFPSVHSLSLLGNRTGFLVSSFDVSSENRIYFIQSDFFAEEDALPSQLVDAVAALPTRECSYGLSDAGQIQQRQSYLSAVAQLIREIRKGSVSKVVYSRTVSKKSDFSDGRLPFLYSDLQKDNPEACVFWFCIPDVGMWMGASPELFLRKRNSTVETVALAGTQTSPKEWTSKNREEQAYVEQYVKRTFERVGLTDLDLDGPQPVRAGHVFHLKTAFRAKMPESVEWTSVLESLHPTPAVCGCPKDAAQRLIRQMELSERSFYSGFLGPYWGDGDFEFFVNLRSMRIVCDEAILYVGGGITKDSNPEDEWQETELKSMTMGRLL